MLTFFRVVGREELDVFQGPGPVGSWNHFRRKRGSLVHVVDSVKASINFQKFYAKNSLLHLETVSIRLLILSSQMNF